MNARVVYKSSPASLPKNYSFAKHSKTDSTNWKYFKKAFKRPVTSLQRQMYFQLSLVSAKNNVSMQTQARG